ncbi:MAG: hypothetical protein IJX28_02120 [Clostridia bacterium]|nr:hypothetical protein [Clostridia bacterium]
MRKKILIYIGVLCLVLLACLPLFLGPLEPLEEDAVVMQLNKASNSLEIHYPDGTENLYPLEEIAQLMDIFRGEPYISRIYPIRGEETESFFETFFRRPVSLLPVSDCPLEMEVWIYLPDDSSLLAIGVDEKGNMVLSKHFGSYCAYYGSTDGRFTPEKMNDIFSAPRPQ